MIQNLINQMQKTFQLVVDKSGKAPRWWSFYAASVATICWMYSTAAKPLDTLFSVSGLLATLILMVFHGMLMIAASNQTIFDTLKKNRILTHHLYIFYFWVAAAVSLLIMLYGTTEQLPYLIKDLSLAAFLHFVRCELPPPPRKVTKAIDRLGWST